MDNIHCPKCGCTDIHITEKGYSIKKGLLGYVTIGAIGTLFGLHGNKKLCVFVSNVTIHLAHQRATITSLQ